MARRLASAGYYVMLPNLYHRSGVEEIGDFIGEAGTETRKKMFALMATLNIALVMEDTDRLVAHADADPAASNGAIGTVGYCMSGQYAISAAARFPGRVRAAASIYGVRLKTDASDSPHLAARKGDAEFYVAWAETDHYAPLEELPPFETSLREGGVKHEVELYKGADHGFAFSAAPRLQPRRGRAALGEVVRVVCAQSEMTRTEMTLTGRAIAAVSAAACMMCLAFGAEAAPVQPGDEGDEHGCIYPSPSTVLGYDPVGIESVEFQSFMSGNRNLRWLFISSDGPADGTVFVLTCGGRVIAKAAARLRPAENAGAMDRRSRDAAGDLCFCFRDRDHRQRIGRPPAIRRHVDRQAVGP